MRRAIDAVREVLLEVAAGSFVRPPRLALGDGRVLVMTAFHQQTGTAAVKALEARLDRMPAIIGTVTRMGANGRIIADASAITTLRIGAIAGVATDALAPRDASVMPLFGAGAQAPDQVRAVHTVRPLTALTVFDRNRPRAEKLPSELEGDLPGVHLRSADDVTTALTDVEIVSCATSSSTPLFPADALPARRTCQRDRLVPADDARTAGRVARDRGPGRRRTDRGGHRRSRRDHPRARGRHTHA
ncbi:hypothetical protein [Embleya sp. NPDC005971]|uniref:hypothetical protein n=1 Tax=Embleya sp. NPDC005971 TaxID=3156724 RepID=UPI0033CB5D6A